MSAAPGRKPCKEWSTRVCCGSNRFPNAGNGRSYAGTRNSQTTGHASDSSFVSGETCRQKTVRFFKFQIPNRSGKQRSLTLSCGSPTWNLYHCRKRSKKLFDHGLAARHPLRILLAEDNAINQKVGLKMLSQLGYTADLAVNGLRVLEALNKTQYDLILMDIQMPEMGGIETTGIIRERFHAHHPLDHRAHRRRTRG